MHSEVFHPRFESYINVIWVEFECPIPSCSMFVECTSRHLGYVRNSSSLSAWKIELNAFCILIIHSAMQFCTFFFRFCTPKISLFVLPELEVEKQKSRDPVPFECEALAWCRWYFEAKWKVKIRENRVHRVKFVTSCSKNVSTDSRHDDWGKVLKNLNKKRTLANVIFIISLLSAFIVCAWFGLLVA